MSKFKLINFLSMVVLAVVCSAAVAAQNAESYVDTTAPLGQTCLRTAPCQTFAEAIAKTNDGGEIRVLTIGNYGPFTITKVISPVTYQLQLPKKFRNHNVFIGALFFMACAIATLLYLFHRRKWI